VAEDRYYPKISPKFISKYLIQIIQSNYSVISPTKEKMSLKFYEIIGGKKVLGFRNIDSEILIFGSSHIKTIKNGNGYNLLCIPGGGIVQFKLALDRFRPVFSKMKMILFLDIGNDLLDRNGELLQNSHGIIDSTRMIINLIHEVNIEAKIVSLDTLPRPSLDNRLLTQLDIVSRLITPFNDNHTHLKTFKTFTERKGHPRVLSQNLKLFQGPQFVHLNDEGSLKLNLLIDNLLITFIPQ
jgi:hypothetical protein